jgi:hypothetical protein
MNRHDIVMLTRPGLRDITSRLPAAGNVPRRASGRRPGAGAADGRGGWQVTAGWCRGHGGGLHHYGYHRPGPPEEMPCAAIGIRADIFRRTAGRLTANRAAIVCPDPRARPRNGRAERTAGEKPRATQGIAWPARHKERVPAAAAADLGTGKRRLTAFGSLIHEALSRLFATYSQVRESTTSMRLYLTVLHVQEGARSDLTNLSPG